MQKRTVRQKNSRLLSRRKSNVERNEADRNARMKNSATCALFLSRIYQRGGLKSPPEPGNEESVKITAIHDKSAIPEKRRDMTVDENI